MVDCKNLQDRFRYITHFARAFLFHLRLFQGLICLPHPCYVWQSACWVWRWPSRTDTVPIRSTLYCIYMFYQCFCQVSVKFCDSHPFSTLVSSDPPWDTIGHGARAMMATVPMTLTHGLSPGFVFRHQLPCLLQVHEKPNTWAEVWLSFQDKSTMKHCWTSAQ